jgi:hypothetical protein
LKARKTPSSVHPPAPPKIPLAIETLYCAVDNQILDTTLKQRGTTVVTTQTLYNPGLLAIARVVFEGTRWKLYHERDVVRVVPFPETSQMVDWDQNQIEKWDNSRTRSDAQGVSFYVFDSSFAFTQERFEELQGEFVQYLLTKQTLELDYNPHLKIHRKLDEAQDQFQARCLEKLREMYAQEYQTLLDTLSRQEDRLKEKLDREVREHGNPEDGSMDLSKIEDNQTEMDSHGAKVDMEDIRRELAEIGKLREAKLNDFEESLQSLSRQCEKDILRVNHGNIKILRFALVWLPYTELVIQDGDSRRIEIVKSF